MQLPFSLPTLSLPAFISNRRKTLTWVAGTVGGVYVLGQWGFRKMGEMAERASQEGLDKDNLARRFALNCADCQFTILALLPTLSSQVLSSMDVEGVSAQLAQVAARAKAREREQSEAEERGREEERRALEVTDTGVEVKVEGGEDKDPPEEALGGEEQVEDKVEVPSSPGLNPGAATFVPSFSFAPKPAAESVKEPVAEEEAVEEPVAEVEGYAVEEAEAASQVEAPQAEAPLSRSWAEVVVRGNGNAEEVENKPEVVPPPALPPTIEEPVAPGTPEPSRADLWNEIKILSYTRTITSLYILTLLTLQTHVQLSLLGRSAYVTSVLSVLPNSSVDLLSIETEEDLEMALYGKEKESIGVSKETERMFLTMSWWLLHRGWRVVGDRVREAVEEVVGPMALKTPVVYGELSLLLSQIRHKIEHNPDGSSFNFSPTLFPPTAETELETLSAGGLPSSISPSLRRLLNETSDILDSPDCALVRSLCLDRLFSQLLGAMEGPFRPREMWAAEEGSRFEDVTERTAKLASLLPTVARQSHLVLNGMPNEYVEALEDVRELAEFSAIIYGSFDMDNVRGSC